MLFNLFLNITIDVYNAMNQSHYIQQDLNCDVLRGLVLFVQFKKCEKHPWRSHL